MENFCAWQGTDIVSWDPQDDDNPSKPRIMRQLKATTIADFVKAFAEETGKDAAKLRPWIVVNRQNGTKRPDQPLLVPDMTLEDAALKHSNRQPMPKFWMEELVDEVTEPGADGVQTNGTEKKQIAIFLKHFDIEKQQLSGLGYAYMSPNDRVQDLAKPILKMTGWDAGSVDLKLYEEIKPNFVEVMKPAQTLQASELQDGDIVCFQKAFTPEQLAVIQARSPAACVTAPTFYDYLLNRIEVTFAFKPGMAQHVTIEPIEDSGFTLFLSKKDTYDVFATRVAEHLSSISNTTIDPTHLRFTTVNANSNKPRAIVKRSPALTLHSVLFGSATNNYGSYGYTNQASDALYYEVLEMSLADLEQRKLVKFVWLTDGINKEVRYSIF